MVGISHTHHDPSRSWGRLPIDAPMFVKGLPGVAGRPVMGHSGEGELLLGHAVSGHGWVGWRPTYRSKDNRLAVSGSYWVRPPTQNVVSCAGAAGRSRGRRNA